MNRLHLYNSLVVRFYICNFFWAFVTIQRIRILKYNECFPQDETDKDHGNRRTSSRRTAAGPDPKTAKPLRGMKRPKEEEAQEEEAEGEKVKAKRAKVKYKKYKLFPTL